MAKKNTSDENININDIIDTEEKDFNIDIKIDSVKEDSVEEPKIKPKKETKKNIDEDNYEEIEDVDKKKVYIVSHKVRIVRKESGVSAFRQQNLKMSKQQDDSVYYIGASTSAYKNCFTYEERDFYMPKILLNIKASDESYSEKIETYFANIKVPISLFGGKELEIGFRYDNLPSRFVNNGRILEDKIPEKDKYKYGTPLIPEEYLLYRYCLVYRFVAKTLDAVFVTPNIKFYIQDLEQENLEKEKTLQKKVIAFKYLGEIKDNVSKTNAVINVMSEQLGLGKNSLVMSKAEKLEALNDFIERYIDKFLLVCNDKDLEHKYSLNIMINTPEIMLTKVPNTETYYYDNQYIIAQSTNVMISYLKNAPAEHLARINFLKAQLTNYLEEKNFGNK